MQVTATATARNIRIGDVTIGRVTTTATSWSNGRPSRARRTVFTREVCRIATPTQQLTGCYTDEQLASAVNDINGRLKPHAELRLPPPDADYMAGSPGGYIGGVTKSIPWVLDDLILNRDTRTEVAGLELLVYHDAETHGSGRDIFQFAAVRAVVTYGIQCASPYVHTRAHGRSACINPVDDATVESADPIPGAPGAPAIPSNGSALTPPAEPVSKRQPVLTQVTEIVRRWLVRAFGEGLLASMVWLILGFPLVFAARHRTLIRSSRTGGTR